MNRNDGIDLLRGISILSVILVHCAIHMPFAHQFLPTALNNIVFHSGYYGVILFFVISGFIITSTCLRRWSTLDNIHIGEFYRMRFARIMPCLILLLIISSILHLLRINGFTIHTTSLPEVIFSALTFHINELRIQTGFLPANLDVLWTLSIEEMFYLFFPIVCLFIRNRFYFILFMFIFIVVAPFSNILPKNTQWSEYYYFSNMDGVAIGCLCALISNQIKFDTKKLASLFWIGFLLFSLIFFFRHFSYKIGITKIGLNTTLIEIGVGLMLIVMQQRNKKGRAWSLLLRWFGKNSYEIYLTHSFVIITFSLIIFNKNMSNVDILLLYLFTIILSGVVGQILASYFSEPMNLWIRSKKFIFKTKELTA